MLKTAVHPRCAYKKSIFLNKPCHNELEKARASTKDPELPEPTPPQGFIRPGQPCVTTTFAFIMKPAQAQRANGEHQDRFEFMHVPTNTPDLQHRLSEIFLHHEEHK